MRNERAMTESAAAAARPVPGVRWRPGAGEQCRSGRAPADRADAGRRSSVALPPRSYDAPYSGRPLPRRSGVASGQTSPGWSSVAARPAVARRVARRRHRDSWRSTAWAAVAGYPSRNGRVRGAVPAERVITGFLSRERHREQCGPESTMGGSCASGGRPGHAIGRVPDVRYLPGFLGFSREANDIRNGASSACRWSCGVAPRARFRSSPFAGRIPGNPGLGENPRQCPTWHIARAAGSRITDLRETAGRNRFVRRGAPGKTISGVRRLTIRRRPAMDEWTPDNSAVRGFACRVFVRSAVRCGFAAGSIRVGWRDEFRVLSRYMADFIFRVTNITAATWPDFVVPRLPAAGRSAIAWPTADWRWPVRWRTVAE